MLTHFTQATRQGVGASKVWLPEGDWQYLIDFLVARFTAVPAAVWRTRMQDGLVTDLSGAPLPVETRYQPAQHICYYRDIINEVPIPFQATIVYEDELIVVADKPHFLPVIPSGQYVQETLLVRLKNQLGIDTLAPMHRIDRETAGLVLFTKQSHTRAAYAQLFKTQQITKQYEAIAPLNTAYTMPYLHSSRMVEGEPFYRMQEVAGEPNSQTQIVLLESIINHHINLGRYALSPISGKQHQLRVHMASLGMAIINDPLYPTLQAFDRQDYRHPLQLLAKRIGFVDPITGEPRLFESQLRLLY